MRALLFSGLPHADDATQTQLHAVFIAFFRSFSLSPDLTTERIDSAAITGKRIARLLFFASSRL